MAYLAHHAAPAHVIVRLTNLGNFVRRPQLEQQMNIGQIQRQVIAKSGGQATHVVSAVYENSAAMHGNTSQQIFLFIGGNLSGVSPGGFVASFSGQFAGARAASPGPMGGSASCVSRSGSNVVAVCVWADNDTFGVLASSTMSVTQLSQQMLAIRPKVERSPSG